MWNSYFNFHATFLFHTLLVRVCLPLSCRDAVAKILYSLLFHWLTERINAQVYPRQHSLSISILDIYGFEVQHTQTEHHLFVTLLCCTVERLQCVCVCVCVTNRIWPSTALSSFALIMQTSTCSSSSTGSCSGRNR